MARAVEVRQAADDAPGVRRVDLGARRREESIA